MTRKLIPALTVLIATVTAVWGGRKDDFEFAQGLVEFKYYDLAREQFEAIINDSSRSAEERANGELGLALLLKALADDMTKDSKKPVADVTKAFEDAEAAFDKFLSTYPGHPRTIDAKFEVGTLLQAKGGFLSDQQAKDPGNAEQYRKTAEDAFDNAAELFKGAADGMEQRLRQMSDEEKESDRGVRLDWDYRRARFFEAVAVYKKGELYVAGGAERQGTLGRAEEKLRNFVWENEDNILGGYAYFYLGMAARDLDKPDEALEWFSTAFGSPVPDMKGDPDEYTKWTELYLQSYWMLFEYCATIGRREGRDYRDDALKFAEEMQQRVPDYMDRLYGHRAMLAYARCLLGIGEKPKALDVATRISAKGDEIFKAGTLWGGGTSYLANQLINEIISESGGEFSLPPDVLLKAALGKKASREWGDAVRAFQAVFGALKTEEQVKQYAIQVWLEIGEAYYRQERYLEAFFAFDYIVATYRKTDEAAAGDAAYKRYRAATALFAASKDPADEALKKKARSSFAEEFPTHPRSIDLQYYEGADYVDDADAAKDAAAAKKNYELALERLAGVKKTSILYEKALARAAEVLFKLTEYVKAMASIDAMEKFIADPENVTTDPERKANRIQAKAIGTYYRALCQSKLKQPDKVLETLKGYETTYADDNTKAYHAPVILERVRALIEVKNLDEAEKEAIRLRKEFESYGGTPLAFFLVGNAYKAASDAAADKATKGEVWRGHLKKAADYLSWYVHHKTQVTAAEWETIGLWYHQLKEWAPAEEALTKALELYNQVLDKLKPDSPDAVALVKKEDGISVLLSEILIAQEKFAEAKAVFERLLIPTEGARVRVMEILLMPEFSDTVLKELMTKIRAVPSIMTGLALAYRKLGQRDDMVRGMTLLQILLRVDRSKLYTPEWWAWQLMLWETWLDYGVLHRDPVALKNITGKWKSLDGLGVMKNSGLEKEFSSIYQKAQTELVKMGG